MSRVVVMPKEGWTGEATPILLLVWHRLSKNVIYDVSRVRFWKVSVISKQGMTPTQDIRDLFAWCGSSTIFPWLHCKHLTSSLTNTYDGRIIIPSHLYLLSKADISLPHLSGPSCYLRLTRHTAGLWQDLQLVTDHLVSTNIKWKRPTSSMH